MNNYTVNGDVVNQCESCVVSCDADNFNTVVRNEIKYDETVISNNNSCDYNATQSISLRGECVSVGLYI